MKKTLKYILIFISMLIIFCILLTVTSLIPRELLTKKVKESSEILNGQTNSLIIKINDRETKFDNFSDSLMINTAYSIDNTTPFYSSMMARKNYIKGKTEIIYPDTTGELKSSSKYKGLNQVGDLADTVNNDTTESFEYARYWHGYLIFLRPLLTLFNITQIRIILFILFGILAIILINQIYKKINLGTAIIFLCGLLICDYFYLGITLQGAPVFLIVMISSIILLSRDIKDKNAFFLIIGGLTSFFDFLTVPILTLAVPLLIYSLIQNKNQCDVKKIFIELLKYCIMWGIGYIGLWLMKWVIVDLVYHRNLIQTSLNQFMYRSEAKNISKNNLLEPIKYIANPLFLSIVILSVLMIVKLIKYKGKKIKFSFKEISVYFSIVILVLSWILVLRQHFFQHLFFTYRNLFPICVCFMLMIYNLFKVEPNKNEKGMENKE